MTSSFFASTAERWKNSASRDFDMTLARLVFPHPGGPQRRIEGSRPASMNFLICFPSPIRCACQTRSLKFSGRRREARGVISFSKREIMEWIVRIFPKKKNSFFSNFDRWNRKCYYHFMNKQNEYKNHASSIIGIYESLQTELDEGDKKWIEDIFEATAYIDDFLDTIKDRSTLQRAMGWILNMLNLGSSPDVLDSWAADYCLAIRERILSLPDGLEHLSRFTATLRRLFRSTLQLKKTTDIQEYVRYSLLEWRSFGKLVALWVRDKTHLRVIQQAWGMENLTDDMLDIKKDYHSKERNLPPSIAFYREWVKMTVLQILNMYGKFGFIDTTKAIKSSSRAMWLKYIVEPMRETHHSN